MQLTVLGKYGPYGKAGEGAASGYLVTDRDFRFLCDMGSGVLSRLINVIDVRQLDGIFISHLHYDHTSDLLPFRYLLEELEHPVKIFTHKEDSAWYRILFSHPLFEIVDIDENTEFEIRGVNLTFYKMKHAIDNYAILFDGTAKLLYTGDTQYNENLVEAAKRADLVLADCSKPDVFIGAHMKATEGLKLQEETGAEILATHLAPDFSPENLFAGNDKISVAEEGKTYTVRHK